MGETDGEKFADFEWQKRWNESKGIIGCIDRVGDRYMLVNCMGVIHCDREDLTAIRNQLQSFVNLLNKEIDSY